MTRDRPWRRAQAERKFRRVLSWKTRKSLYIFDYITERLRGRFTYIKRNSHNELIEVDVLCESHCYDYFRNAARVLRDNPKNCSCTNCCSTKSWGYGNCWKRLSIQERSAIVSAAEELDDCDHNPPSFKWRSRKTNA